MKTKRFQIAALAFSAAIMLISCATTKKVSDKEEPVEEAKITYDENHNTPLMQYARDNRLSGVKSELKKEVYYENNREILNTQNDDGNNALHLAVLNRNAEIVKAVAKSCIECNIRNKYGYAPLHLAVLAGDEEISLILLKEAKADINVTDKIGATPLILAAKNNLKEMVDFLLKNGANPKKTDNNGKDYKFYMPASDIKELKIEAEPTLGEKRENQIYIAPVEETLSTPELNPQNYEIIFGKIPDDAKLLHAIMEQNYTKVKELTGGKNLKASVTERDSAGNSALMYAVTLNNISYMKQLLLASREWVNTPNNYGQTPLLAAIAMTMHNNTILMLENNANVNARDIAGNTPLSLTIMQNDVAVSRRLIQKQARTTFKYKNSNTILQQAIINNSFEMIKMILANVPELNLAYKNLEGKTAREIAEELISSNKIEKRVFDEVNRAYSKYEEKSKN